MLHEEQDLDITRQTNLRAVEILGLETIAFRSAGHLLPALETARTLNELGWLEHVKDGHPEVCTQARDQIIEAVLTYLNSVNELS